MISRSILAAALLAAMPAGPALAQDGLGPDAGEQTACELSLRTPANLYYRGALSRGYDVFSGQRHQEVLRVEVTHRGAACRWSLSASSQSGASASALSGPGAQTLAYEVRRDPAGENLLTGDYSGLGPDALTGEFSDGDAAVEIVLYVEIPPGQMVAAGEYQDLVMMRLFRDDGVAMDLADERGAWVSVDVPASIEAGIGDILGAGGQSASVDLGRLHSGLRRPLNFAARTNTPVEIAFSSQNAGRLRHETAPAISVPYQIIYRGETVSPDGAASASFRHVMSTETEIHDFEVEIGDIPGGGVAGSYSDILTITISSS